MVKDENQCVCVVGVFVVCESEDEKAVPGVKLAVDAAAFLIDHHHETREKRDLCAAAALLREIWGRIAWESGEKPHGSVSDSLPGAPHLAYSLWPTRR